MIIDYHKSTGQIIGVIEGRLHDDKIINGTSLSVSGIEDSDLVRYVVPFKQVFETVHEEITELRVVDPKTLRVEKVVVGHTPVEKPKGYVPDVPFADLILAFESYKENIYDYRIQTNEQGEVIGFVKN